MCYPWLRLFINSISAHTDYPRMFASAHYLFGWIVWLPKCYAVLQFNGFWTQLLRNCCICTNNKNFDSTSNSITNRLVKYPVLNYMYEILWMTINTMNFNGVSNIWTVYLPHQYLVSITIRYKNQLLHVLLIRLKKISSNF